MWVWNDHDHEHEVNNGSSIFSSSQPTRQSPEDESYSSLPISFQPSTMATTDSTMSLSSSTDDANPCDRKIRLLSCLDIVHEIPIGCTQITIATGWIIMHYIRLYLSICIINAAESCMSIHGNGDNQHVLLPLPMRLMRLPIIINMKGRRFCLLMGRE